MISIGDMKQRCDVSQLQPGDKLENMYTRVDREFVACRGDVVVVRAFGNQGQTHDYEIPTYMIERYWNVVE